MLNGSKRVLMQKNGSGRWAKSSVYKKRKGEEEKISKCNYPKCVR